LVMTLYSENDNELREYLLGDLTEEARRRVEQRLLTEPDFLEELLAGEEELIDEYVGDELSVDERLKFEQHFLCTTERRQQLRFARALSRYASESEAKEVVVREETASVPATPATTTAPTPAPPALKPTPRPTLAERLRAFFGGGGFAPRAAVGLAALAVVAVALLTVPQLRTLLFPQRTSPPKTFATITLAAGAGERGAGEKTTKVSVPLKEDALRILLTLPEGTPASARYDVELENEKGLVEHLEATAQDARTVSLEIPSEQLARGRYALRLSAIGADGKKQRVPGGSYLFNAE
jgi:anti-sigma factor RsiW